MNTTEQINALVERFGLSETVKQEIIKIVEYVAGQEFGNGYNEGFQDCLDNN